MSTNKVASKPRNSLTAPSNIALGRWDRLLIFSLPHPRIQKYATYSFCAAIYCHKWLMFGFNNSSPLTLPCLFWRNFYANFLPRQENGKSSITRSWVLRWSWKKKSSRIKPTACCGCSSRHEARFSLLSDAVWGESSANVNRDTKYKGSPAYAISSANADFTYAIFCHLTLK